MGFLHGVTNIATRSDAPIRRLLVYYGLLAIVLLALGYFFPSWERLFSGAQLEDATVSPQAFQDGLMGVSAASSPTIQLSSQARLALGTLITMIGTLVLMLPVSWVYMSGKSTSQPDQTVAQTLLILPIVVGGIVIVVQNSLALAFSLAGVVAAVRFRTNMKESRDVVFVFLAIAVGFAAGVQALIVGATVSVIFNFVLLLIWRYDFGRNALEPSATAQWSAPLADLAQKDNVPDRDLALALTPKKAESLADRFNRVSEMLGDEDKKPRYNAILHLVTSAPEEAQQRVESVLDKVAKRWKLDEVTEEPGKPCELYYLVRIKKDSSQADLLTAVRTRAGDKIAGADIEIGEALAMAGKNGKNGKSDKTGKSDKNGKNE